MALAKAERVAGRHLGAAVRGPSGATLGPATPIPGPARVPVRLVGETAPPASEARVISRARSDLVHQAPELAGLFPFSREANNTGGRGRRP